MKGKYLSRLLLALGIAFATTVPASAHPELILYVDTSATIHSEENAIFLDYYIAKSDQISFADLAIVAGDIERLSREQCQKAAMGFRLSVGDFQIPLELDSSHAIEKLSTTGAGTWIECHFSSQVEFFGDNQFSWIDDNFNEFPGHREFNVGLETSPSQNLTDYTKVITLLNQQRSVFTISFPNDVEVSDASKPRSEPQPEKVVVTPSPSPIQTPKETKKPEARAEQSWLTTTSNRYFRALDPSFIIVLVGTVIAFVLGALHSIAPGHGKSIMAVLALAEGGKRREIIKLGLTMGATHTLGVFLLGTLFILGSTSIPRSVIPTLGIISGMLIGAIGTFYIFRYFKHRHEHRHGTEHHHHDEIGSGRIALLGIVGGMVPTPTALTILIGTAALGSAWYGILLVASYGFGMTTILIFAGRLVERIFRYAEDLADSRIGLRKLVEVAPFFAASLQVIAGVFLVVISLRTLT